MGKVIIFRDRQTNKTFLLYIDISVKVFGQKLYVCQHKISLFVLFRVRKKNKMEDDLTVCFDAVLSRFVCI